MSNITFQLDPIALREATTQSIMGILTPEIRAQILQSAISSLLSPSTNSWEKGMSPIQQAFNRAIESVALEVAREHVKNSPEIIDKLKELIAETAAKVFSADVDKMAAKMAEAFIASMRQEKW